MRWVALVFLLSLALGCVGPDWDDGAPGEVHRQWPSGWALDVGWATEARGEV